MRRVSADPIGYMVLEGIVPCDEACTAPNDKKIENNAINENRLY